MKTIILKELILKSNIYNIYNFLFNLLFNIVVLFFIIVLYIIYYTIMQHMIKRRNLNFIKKKKKKNNIKINIFNIKLIYMFLLIHCVLIFIKYLLLIFYY